MKLYAIYDKKVGCFSDPLVYVSDSIALSDCQNAFSTAVLADKALKDYYNDLDLYYLGEYDVETGVIYSPERPNFVGKCYVEKEVKENEA